MITKRFLIDLGFTEIAPYEAEMSPSADIPDLVVPFKVKKAYLFEDHCNLIVLDSYGDNEALFLRRFDRYDPWVPPFGINGEEDVFRLMRYKLESDEFESPEEFEEYVKTQERIVRTMRTRAKTVNRLKASLTL